MSKYIQNIEFFKDAGINKSQELQDVAATLHYLKVPARTEVFDYGEHGENLFIILDGIVDVIVPTNKTEKGFLKR